jgi:PAS domain S-box-containing protein
MNFDKRTPVERAAERGRERKRADHESANELRDFIEIMPAMAFAVRPDGSWEFVSRRWQEYSGLSQEAAVSGAWEASVHPDDLDRHLEKWQVSLANGEPLEIELRHRNAKGEYRWFSMHVAPRRDEHGRIVKWLGALTDIDDRKRGDALLAGQMRLLEMIAAGVALNEILNALCSIIEEQRSGTLASVLLLNPDGVHLNSVAGPSLPAAWTQQMERLPIGPCAGSCGTAAYRGSAVIVSDIATDALWDVPEHRASALEHGLRASWSSPVLSWKGKVLGTFCMYYREPRTPNAEDLKLIEFGTQVVRIAVERDRAKQALSQSEAYLAEAQRLTHTGSWASSQATGQGHYWSEEMFRIFGFDPEQCLPPHQIFWQRVHPEDRDKVREQIQRAVSRKVDYVVEHRIVLPDGTLKHVQSIGHPRRGAAGDVVEYVGTAVDVTERKRAEEEHERLRQLEADLARINRVSMMGELAASLAHDIKQPIAAAMMNANACAHWQSGDAPDMTEARKAALRMVADVTRAAEIIDRVRSIYRRGPPQQKPVDLNALVREMIGLLRDAANRSSVSIRTELDAGLPITRADRVQLQQVLMNLMLNGIEAMKDSGGELTVASKRIEDDQLLVSVSDSGSGFPIEESERLFEAFFTTKPQGTGMGLSISRRIVVSHGGRLWASANTGRGATFQFTLPTEAAASFRSAGQPRSSARS